MASRDGNGWVRCELGHRHWGRFGAAGLLAYVTAGPVLLQRRTWWSHHGGTWGLPGGARDSHESALAAALREAHEECGVPPDAVRQRAVFTDDHGGWSYTTVLAEADQPFEVNADDDETDGVTWASLEAVRHLDLHPGLAAHWAELAAELSPVTIIVDGANVVGSRPDGWWRDRVGANARLRDQLTSLGTGGLTALPDTMAAPARAGHLPLDGDGIPEPGRMGEGQTMFRWLPEVVLVVEGAARPVADDPSPGGVRVLAAQRSGDDTIAVLAAHTPGRRVVVTADRELKRRCVEAGASVVGPSWLLGLL
ncbi:MAG: NUDIX domain-containing protein [Actinobacteria bacterium]|nr:NUDIX domain-containing protein [Actinomycetota bacterium]